MKRMAFWADNKFPYVKYGEITHQHPGKCVSVAGVEDPVEPEFILPLSVGVKLVESIEVRRRDYDRAILELHQSHVEVVGKLLMPYIDTKEFFTIGKLKP
mgnify:CR=1 FL=1